jgi:PTS system cellobiose-specific IIA component
MVNQQEYEEIIFTTISWAGEARKHALTALELYTKGDVEGAERALKESFNCIAEANRALFKLIKAESGGEKVPITLLLVHACDILISATTLHDIVESIIKLDLASRAPHKNEHRRKA